MDFDAVRDISSDKLVQALRIVNQQLAQANTQTKRELYLSEQRFNEVNGLLLCARQENTKLREMVRKLNDQLSIASKVLFSVKEQSEHMFEVINRPHSTAEENERNRQPRASQVYERMRTDNPPYVHEAMIPEEDEEEEEEEELPVDETHGRTQYESTDLEGSQLSLPAKDTSASGVGGQLLPNSPLVQRLKRPSKNTSFDESFETIERDRVFKHSRVTRERRQIYGGLAAEEPSDTVRQLVSMETIRSSTAPTRERSLKSIASSDIVLEDTIRETMNKPPSPGRMEVNNSSSSDSTQTERSIVRYDYSNNPDRYVLKKTASESMLSTIHRATTTGGEDGELSRCSFDDTTEFCPEDTIANASCSTPVTKGGSSSTLAKAAGPGRTRPLTVHQKMKSDSALNRKTRQAVVVLRPLTEDNLRSLTHETQQRTERIRARRAAGNLSPETWESATTTLEPSSSTENLSVMSNESGRPRRKAAPKTLREHSLRAKMRRN